MTSNLQGGEESSKGSNTSNGAPESDSGSNDFNAMISSSVDQSYEEILLGYDLDALSTVVDGTSSHPLGMKNPYDHMMETRCFLENLGKTCTEKQMSSNGENPYLDLSLTLSPPWTNTKDESFNESVSSSSPTKCSSMSLEHNPAGTLYKTDTLHVPSLILMGCTNCYMYLIVSEIDPMCPKCKSSFLLDVFRN